MALLALVAAPMQAGAATNDPAVKPASISVAVDDNYPPYIFRDTAGNLQGILKDRWDLWSQKTGVRVELIGTDWGKALQRMETGNADVIDTIFETEHRKQIYDFSAPYATIEVPIFFHKSIGGITDAGSLRGFTVGAKDGDACIDWLSARDIANFKRYSSYEALIDAAAKSDVRVMCIDKPPGLYFLYRNNLENEFRYSAPLYSGQFHWAVAHGKADLYRLIENGFSQISEGELRAIDTKWMGSALPGGLDSQTFKYAAYLLLSTLLAVTLLAVWNRVLQQRVIARTGELETTLDALRLSQQHFQQLVATTPVGVFETGADGSYLYVNDRWLNITGLSLEQALGAGWTAALHPDDRVPVFEEWLAMSVRHRSFHLEHRFLRPDGGVTWVLAQASPRLDDSGAEIGYIGSVTDISDRKAAEEALRENEVRFRTIFNGINDAIFIHDITTGAIVAVNERMLEMYGYRAEEIPSLDVAELSEGVTPHGSAEAKAWLDKAAAGEPQLFEWSARRKDGQLFWVEISIRRAHIDGPKDRLLVVVRDISERKTAELALRQSEDHLRKLSKAVEQSPVAVVITDIEGAIQYVNPAFCDSTGYAAAEVLGANPRILQGPDHTREYYSAMWSCIKGGTPWRGTFHNRRKDGSLFWEEAVIAPVRGHRGEITHFVGIKQDISARREAEARIEFLAHHDPLTELPNRLLGRDRMELAMARADRLGGKAGLLFLDLDHFKRVNDALGHPLGDALLKAIAGRLQTCLRATDTISRQGGDEFLIILPDVDAPEAIGIAATTILEQLTAPFVIDGHELSTSISIGIAVYPDDGREFDTLLKRADTAMYHAKDAGRNAYRFFTEQMNEDANEYLHIRSNLQRGLERGEFVLHYQPQIDLSSGRVLGVEALIRWNHPTLGMVPPGRFISIAEDSGLIVPIGEWVLVEACRQAMAWRAEGLPALVMAVNLSAVQFKRGDLLATIQQALTGSGLDPARLELELTESILIKNTANVLLTVQHLKALGIKLSIDDFGTGYSSLAYLKRFEVDKVKIDQSFVRDITTDANDDAIVHAIVQMARGLGLRTIAEGVEDIESLDILRQHGCDEVQGYYFARPMPADQLAAYLADNGGCGGQGR